MRSVGVDVASVGYAAVGLAVNGVPKLGVAWKADKRSSVADRLAEQERWLAFQFGIMKPDIIAVEELAVFMNKKVIRALSRHEGVALLAAKKHGAIVLNPPVTKARAIVFKGQGVRSKEDAWQAFKRKFPDFKLPGASSGGMDVADALVHALAAPAILEQR